MALSILCASVGNASEVEELSNPSPVDFGDVRALTDEVINQIIAGNAKSYLPEVAAKNPLMVDKKTEILSVANQFASIVELYGPITQCVPWQQSYSSSLRITTSYVCQHRDALIFWEFQNVRLPKGWVFSNFRFDGTF